MGGSKWTAVWAVAGTAVGTGPPTPVPSTRGPARTGFRLVGYEEGPMNEFKATAYVKAAGVVASVVTLATLVGASYKW
ncbi:hypothetical protein Kisp01_62380 [Kineosporia sp. NBRC 101677]|nr:hypothetical protein Kisp01_62380 [Kineosporia sp. NBRC 101677]